MNTPSCKKKLHRFTEHNLELEDNYHWLRDDNWPNVKTDILEYLNLENNYTEEIRKNFADIEEELFQSMKRKVIEEDSSYPINYSYNGQVYSYYSKTLPGLEHRIYCRRVQNGEEEVILDSNLLAGDNKAFSLNDVEVSNDHQYLAYSEDLVGKERFILHVKDLGTGKLLEDKLEDTIGSIIWNKENNGIYYVKLDENWRGNRIYFHKIGTKQNDDQLIYHEQDNHFTLDISVTSQKDYLLIESAAKDRNEIISINLSDHSKELIISRDANTLYHADYHNNKLYLLTNDKGRNFRLVTRDGEIYREIISHSNSIYLTEFFFTNGYMIVQIRENGLNKFLIYKDDHFIDTIKFNDEPYEAESIFTDYHSKFFRFAYSTPVIPEKIIDYDFAEKTLIERKILSVPNYDYTKYESKRIWAGEIPVTILYRKDTELKNAPTLLYGYGSYGIAISTDFRASRTVLLDKGYVYAIAHIRGGDELGFKWYEDAKFLNKKRTFEDFVYVIRYLFDKQITNPKKLAIMGGSAGGMLVGYMLNNYPELFSVALALVPFVDVLNTMLDESLPLTPGEFNEWGNPKEKEFFDYIRSYSPYDNIKQQNYPHTLITAGINDPRVTYWEATKFVAKLREFKTDNNLLLYRIELEQGHKGQYGKYNALKELAFYYAFIIYVNSKEK